MLSSESAQLLCLPTPLKPKR